MSNETTPLSPEAVFEIMADSVAVLKRIEDAWIGLFQEIVEAALSVEKMSEENEG
jgi:hypothetical protein